MSPPLPHGRAPGGGPGAGRAAPVLHASLLAAPPRPLDTPAGRFRLHRIRDLASGRPLLALSRGALTGPAPLLARVHSSCVTSEALGACDCDCADQLDDALAAIAAEERGLLIYLLQEGRGAGLVAKARDRMAVQASGDRLTTFDAYARMGLRADLRRYEAVPSVLGLLGVEAPLRLLSCNPEKARALERAGVRLAGARPLPHRPTPFSWAYLTAKSRSGHTLARSGRPDPTPALPEPVTELEPRPLDPEGRFVHLARWWLPVRRATQATPRWIRTHVLVDRARGTERLLLETAETGARGGGAPLRVLHDPLRGRLPAGRAATRWRVAAALHALDRRGGGRLLLLGPDESGRSDAATRALAAAPLPS